MAGTLLAESSRSFSRVEDFLSTSQKAGSRVTVSGRLLGKGVPNSSPFPFSQSSGKLSGFCPSLPAHVKLETLQANC